MSNDQPYRVAGKREAYFERFHIGIELRISSPMGVTPAAKRAIDEALEGIQDALHLECVIADHAEIAAAQNERKELLSLFAAPIHCREIPNGYCSKPCCALKRWLSVTTAVGPIVVGWRKRVIVVNWGDSDVQALADVLFPYESATKYDRLIHAWGLDKARAYIAAIIAAGKVSDAQ